MYFIQDYLLSQFSRFCGLIRIKLLTDDDQIRSKVRALSGGRPASELTVFLRHNFS